jgi:hypothetical protein
MKHYRRDIQGVPIHHPQFTARRWNLFPKAPVPPPEGDEHKEDAANDEFSHDDPSFGQVSCVYPFLGEVKPNARPELRLEAGAQRTLLAVACKPLFGAV